MEMRFDATFINIVFLEVERGRWILLLSWIEKNDNLHLCCVLAVLLHSPLCLTEMWIGLARARMPLMCFLVRGHHTVKVRKLWQHFRLDSSRAKFSECSNSRFAIQTNHISRLPNDHASSIKAVLRFVWTPVWVLWHYVCSLDWLNCSSSLLTVNPHSWFRNT
jgi:hypothetical protein